MKSTKYKEIFKLKKMLEDAGIPFSWNEGWGYGKEREEELRKIDPDLVEHYQICYPVFDPEYRWISVIEGFGTFGAEEDRLEIMGGFTPWERYTYGDESVIGHLTAHNVFQRIKNHWEENNKMKKKIAEIDEDTLELTDVYIEVEDDEAEEITRDSTKDFIKMFRDIGDCTVSEFYDAYKKMKQAEAEFKEIYEPLKAKIIELCETQNLPKNIIMDGAKLTYVSASTRTSIDGKKLKEEEPEIAKKFTKTTHVAATVKIEDIGGK